MDWQFEVLSHARKVHFGLIGVSFALVVAATLLPSASLEDAYEQLRVIDTLRTRYLTFENVVPRAESKGVHFLSNREQYLPLRLGDHVELIRKGLQINVGDAGRASIGSTQWGTTRKTSGAKRMVPVLSDLSHVMTASTLSRFAGEWDFLTNAFHARVTKVELDQAKAFYFGEPVDTRALFVEGDPDQASVHIDADLGFLEKVHPTQTFAPRDWYIVIELNTRGIRLPVDEIHVPIGVEYGPLGGHSLIVPLEDTRIPIAKFKDAFGDIARVARGLESLELSELLEYVANLRSENDRQIQLLGVDIPRSVIGQWGILLLVIFQSYFLLHLRHLRGLSIDTDVLSKFPWVGLYGDRYSTITFVASVSALPIAAAGALAWNSGRSGMSIWSIVPLASLSLVLLGLVVLTISQYRMFCSSCLQSQREDLSK